MVEVGMGSNNEQTAQGVVNLALPILTRALLFTRKAMTRSYQSFA